MTEYERALLTTTYCIATENQVLILALAAKLGVDLTQISKDMKAARPSTTL